MSLNREGWILSAAVLCALASEALGQPPAGEPLAAPPATASPPLGDAFARFKAGDFAGALKGLRSAKGASADMPPAQVILAQWFAQANQPGPMRGALERAVTEEPDDPEAYVLLSDIALGEGRLTEAELLGYRAYHLLESLKGSPRRKNSLVPRVLANLAAAREAREDWPGAQKYLGAWLSAEPENPTALQRAGQVLFRQGQTAEATDCFRVAAKLDPNLLAPEVIVARLYELAGKHDKAVQSMAAALAARPSDLKVRLAAAQWALEAGQYAEAQKQAEAAAQINRDSPEARHIKGLVALFLRENAAAEQIFETALKQSPASFAACNNLAVALVEQNDPAKGRRALDQAQENVRRHPRQTDAYSTLGWVLYRLGRTDEAERALHMASSGGTMAPDTAYFLARIALDRGSPAEARQLVQTALAAKGVFLLRSEAEQLLAKLK